MDSLAGSSFPPSGAPPEEKPLLFNLVHPRKPRKQILSPFILPAFPINSSRQTLREQKNFKGVHPDLGRKATQQVDDLYQQIK
mmetsp:Transcript_24442/g.96421  ORF Transcript_24442/g.96421 Transcript_24442/m.96421 type:complete len:83 (+) Transcript_24442:922-1170(+)